MAEEHSFKRDDYIAQITIRRNKAGIAKKEAKEIFRVVNVLDTAYNDLIVTDGYYFFRIRGGTASWKYQPVDPLAGALQEGNFKGTRPERKLMPWTIAILRSHRIESGIAMERMFVRHMRPGRLPLIDDSDLFPKGVLDAVGADSKGGYRYASASALTRAITSVRWTTATGTYVKGIIHLPEFRMTPESLK